ncbi:MAG: phosphoribosylformylglycinamidine cyclo-ligase [Pseudomonadota bacterium]
MNDAYKRAGVDIDAGDALAKAFGPLARATARPGADGALGGFGGLFDLKAAGFDDPILVAGADGVGTKLKLAIAMGKYDTIGVDLVAMCVNDVLAQGAEPLFFLDYFASSKLEPEVAEAVVRGVADGCRQAGCALIGGETAEMPGVYAPGDFDLAGFSVGAAERGNLWPRPTVAGDVLIGLSSSGAHSNGYSLIRKIVAEEKADLAAPAPFDSGTTLGDALIAPTQIYVRSVLPLAANRQVKAFAHITGGGLTDNVPRALSDGLTPHFDEAQLALPPLFQWLQQTGGLSDAELRRTFNCGIGGVLVVDANGVDAVLTHFQADGVEARIIGELQRAAS